MNDQLESKIINLCVAQKDKGVFRNSPAQFTGMACVSRIDLDHFNAQLVSPSFNQGPLNENR